jgi:NAD(P)-dependent dehydrogenase (short-subunit alcohol dehydrogenase family)
MNELSVIVTGGASGIGKAAVRKIVASGGHAGILDLNAAAGAALAQEVGSRVASASADMRDEAAVSAAHDQLARTLPPITGLVNSAAMTTRFSRIEDFPPDEFEDVLLSHTRGTYVPCRVIGSAMARRGQGAIVNLASVLSFRSGPVLGYTMGKAGVVNLTETLAVQWARSGVRVNAVAPGWTDTPFIRKPGRDFSHVTNAMPIGRLLKPEEIAEVIYFLLTPAASGVTGVTIPVDGGYMAGTGWAPFGGVPKQ